MNPPAFQALRRASLEDGLDINRIFPGNSRGTVTERLADALCAHLIRGSDLVLSMHGWSAGYLVEPYVEYPKSGKVSEVSRLAARAFGLGYVNPLEAGPGRLLTVASAMGIPIIEVEIGGQATSLPERQRRVPLELVGPERAAAGWTSAACEPHALRAPSSASRCASSSRRCER